jgi:hypothetical protein
MKAAPRRSASSAGAVEPGAPADANTVGREDAEAERAAEVVGDVDETAGRAGVGGGDARHAGSGQRAQGERLGEPVADHRQRNARHVVAPDVQPAEPGHGHDHRGDARDGDPRVAEAAGQCGDDDRARGERHDGLREERDAGLERAVAADALQVEREEVERAQEHGVEQEARGVRARAPRSCSSRSGMIGCAERAWSATKSASSARPAAMAAAVTGPVPAGVGRPHDPVDEQRRAERRAHGAGELEPAAVTCGLGQHGRAASIAPMPIGTLTMNPTRHDSQSVTAPPSSSPIVTPIPPQRRPGQGGRRHGRRPARRGGPRPVRPRPVRPRRRALDAHGRVPHALGAPRRPPPHHRHQALPPPGRGRAQPHLRPPRARRRRRADDVAYTAEPGSKSAEALGLLGSWAATHEPALR